MVRCVGDWGPSRSLPSNVLIGGWDDEYSSPWHSLNQQRSDLEFVAR